jgi:pimeloyl-ACP methyl ester carboxylesterase
MLVPCIYPTDDCATPKDTHISADVTFTMTYTHSLNESFRDPVTGQWTNVLSVAPPPTRVHVEAGYTSYGAASIKTSYTDGADPSTIQSAQIVRQDLTGNVLTDINPSGYALTNTTPENMISAPAMELVGSTADGDITAGYLVDQYTSIALDQSLSSTGARLSRDETARATPSQRNAEEVSKAFARADEGRATSVVFNGVPVTVRGVGAGLVAVEDVDGGTVEDAANGTAASGERTSTRSRRTRSFRKQEKKWVLAEERAETDLDDSHGARRTVSVTTYRNVKWFENAGRDSARRLARPTTDWIPLSTATANIGAGLPAGAQSAVPGSTRLTVPTGKRHLIACDDQCTGGYVRPPAPGPLGTAPVCINEVVATVNPSNASVNVLYQHGFSSSATTWCKMSEYVRKRFVVGHELRHTLAWYSSYEDQAADLAGRFNADIAGRPNDSPRPGPYVLVGHSNGGIVNRYMAQQFRDPAKVLGVVTVSSPHAGAYLANLNQTILTAAVAVPLVFGAQGCDIAGTYACTWAGLIAREAVAIVGPIMINNVVPVVQEMNTDADFHQTINGRGDASYRIAGVYNRAWDRWTLWRLMADNQKCVPEPLFPCDTYSRAMVTSVDRMYHGYLSCSIASGILGIFWPGARPAAVGCAKNAAWLIAVDGAYKRLSVGSAHGDGVVPEHSQLYPGAPANLQFLVDDSNSHIGETRSQRTADQVNRAINSMGVPFAQ